MVMSIGTAFCAAAHIPETSVISSAVRLAKEHDRMMLITENNDRQRRIRLEAGWAEGSTF